MKTHITQCAGTALLFAALLTLTSCSSTSKSNGVTTSSGAFVPGVPGGLIVRTRKVRATITAIDPATRKVTLQSQNGKSTATAGPEVVNFDQLRVGDKVSATVTEELLVHLAGAGAPEVHGAATMVALAPKGGTPGGFIADTVQVTARVGQIDLKHHTATLVFPDGTTKTLAVRPDVDLTLRRVGEQVVIRATASYAIVVEKR